jgi:hypothetical protein
VQCVNIPILSHGLAKVSVAKERWVNVKANLQGWLPKPGLQFGGHWVLYAAHPATCHSTFIVRVIHAKCTLSSISDSNKHQLHPEASMYTDSSTMQIPASSEACISIATRTDSAPALRYSPGAVDEDPLSWPDLVASMRVAGQVGKRLLLAYLHLPAHASLLSPSCLDVIAVRLLPSLHDSSQ